MDVGYRGIDVDIISYPKNPGKIVWDLLKTTWLKYDQVEYDPNDERVKDLIYKALDKQANPTVFEAINIQVRFKGISRINLAQLTRHRGWLFSAQSQMPQHVKHDVIIPYNLFGSKHFDEIHKLMKISQDVYDKLLEEGYPPQDARYILLHGQTCDCSASFNLNQMVNVCGQRLENNTADEINYTFRKLLFRFKQAIKKDEELDYVDYAIYKRFIDSCDAFGAKQNLSFCCDEVFGNSFGRFPDANNAVSEATINCKYDFRKSAWYNELKRMRREEPWLLLKGEKEMIDNWR